jgi:predicted RNase H-like nuclease
MIDRGAPPATRTLAGADGCRDGWLVVLERPGHEPEAVLAPDAHALVASLPDDALLVLDVPIGLPHRGARRCDVEARAFLGRPRGASVFPAPLRGVLDATDYPDALRRHRALDGRGLSLQAFHLLPRIRDVERLLRERPELRGRVREGHPEVAFALWAGAPIAAPKRSADGRALRAAGVDAVWPDARERARRRLRGVGRYGPDDLLDAFALLWTARRWAAGRARTFPPRVEGRPADRDVHGLAMEIAA